MNAEEAAAGYRCPACGSTLYGWVAARDPVGGGKVVLDRCEVCGLAVSRAEQEPDVGLELSMLTREGGELRAPNRRSLQAAIGGAQWAGLEPALRRLHLTPDSARRLLAGQRIEVIAVRTPFSRSTYLDMVQTLINAFTYRDNFLRNARAGRLRPAGTRQRLLFALDAVVSALVALPLALVALPLELAGSLLGRGGELRLETRPSGEGPARVQS